jgi:hypothetical protein
MGSRNDYKDMLDNVVSLIACVSMITKINSNKWHFSGTLLQIHSPILVAFYYLSPTPWASKQVAFIVGEGKTERATNPTLAPTSTLLSFI